MPSWFSSREKGYTGQAEGAATCQSEKTSNCQSNESTTCQFEGAATCDFDKTDTRELEKPPPWYELEKMGTPPPEVQRVMNRFKVAAHYWHQTRQHLHGLCPPDFESFAFSYIKVASSPRRQGNSWRLLQLGLCTTPDLFWSNLLETSGSHEGDPDELGTSGTRAVHCICNRRGHDVVLEMSTGNAKDYHLAMQLLLQEVRNQIRTKDGTVVIWDIGFVVHAGGNDGTGVLI